MEKVFEAEDMSFEFKPSDFGNYRELTNDGAAQFANDLLQTYLASCPVVYIHKDELGFYGGEGGIDSATHRAVLFNVEPLKDEKCIHPFSHLVTFSNNPHKAQCGICNVELIATWIVKGGS